MSEHLPSSSREPRPGGVVVRLSLELSKGPRTAKVRAETLGTGRERQGPWSPWLIANGSHGAAAPPAEWRPRPGHAGDMRCHSQGRLGQTLLCTCCRGWDLPVHLRPAQGSGGQAGRDTARCWEDGKALRPTSPLCRKLCPST